MNRRKLIFGSILGIVVASVFLLTPLRASIPIPFGFFKPTPSFAYDSEVLAWISAVGANGGTVSQATKDAANTAMVAVKAAGLRSFIYHWNLYAGNQFAACQCPLVHDLGNSPDTFANFVAGDYTESNGLTGDGTSKHLDSGVVPTNLGIDDSAIGICVKTVSNAGGVDIGDFQVGANFLLIAVQNANSFARMGPVAELITGGVTGSGTYTVSRSVADGARLYKNGTNIGNIIATPTGTLPAFNIIVHALDNNGLPGSWSASSITGFHVTKSMTATQMVTWHTILNNFNTTLGR